MKSSLALSVLAVVLATTALGMAGCGAGKQAAGGPRGPSSPSSAFPAGNDQPAVAVTQTPEGSAQPQTQTQTQPQTAAQPAPQPAEATTQPANTTPPAAKSEPKPAASGTGTVKSQAPPPAKSGDAPPLKFAELYSGASVERGLQISEKAQALNGHRVRMTGYMAPPLKPSLDFFVLTRQPMSICPFCSSDADWPDDIILVLVKDQQEAMIGTTPIQVTGMLEVGGKRDPQTGFYSVMRIYADSVKEVK